MNRGILSVVIASFVLSVSAAGMAAERDESASPKGGGMPGMQGMQGTQEGPQGMQRGPGMQGGMQGMDMMQMMRHCQMMMGGRMGGAGMGGGMMPQLPPGNEKLQLQMWAEMMQRMGEIAGKYAAQVK
jgi:hypothetical protein